MKISTDRKKGGRVAALAVLACATVLFATPPDAHATHNNNGNGRGNGHRDQGNGNRGRGNGNGLETPELDPATAAGAFTLLLGSALIAVDERRRRQGIGDEVCQQV